MRAETDKSPRQKQATSSKRPRLRVLSALAACAAVCALALLASPVLRASEPGTMFGPEENPAGSAQNAGENVAPGSRPVAGAPYPAGGDGRSDDLVELEYDPSCVLVTLTAGATPRDAQAEFELQEGLAGVTLAEQTRYYVKFSLPDSLDVARATELMAQAQAVESAEPDYYLQVADDLFGAGQPAGDLLGASQPADGLLDASPQSVLTYASPDDPFYKDDVNNGQWGLFSVNADGAWQATATKQAALAAAAEAAGEELDSVVVAVADNGFYLRNPDFNIPNRADTAAAENDVVYPAAVGDTRPDGVYDVSYDDAAPPPATSSADHGTHVAGIIGAHTNNGAGVAGATYNTCKVMPIRLTNSSGVMPISSLDRALEYVMAKKEVGVNVRVMNMSVGVQASSSSLYNAIQDAHDKGVVVVAAACNTGGNLPNTAPFMAFPSDYDNVVSVINLKSSTNAEGVERRPDSNYNEPDTMEKNISAPGTDIWGLSSSSSNWYVRKYGGTSMASPLVAGVFGLMLTANPELSVDEAVSKMCSSARDLTAMTGARVGWDEVSGYGEVDAQAAVSDEAPYLAGVQVVNAGFPQQFSVKIGGVEQEPSEWAWSSTDTEVATVDDAGKVSGVCEGYARIFATKGETTVCQTIIVHGYTSFNNAQVSIAEQVYSGTKLTPAVTVQIKGVTLKEGTHYRIAGYEDNLDAGNDTAKVTLEGVGSLQDTITAPFTIKKANIGNASIALSATSFAYDGKPKAPSVTRVRDIGLNASEQLAANVDYSVVTSSAVLGTGHVVITATDACKNFTGSVSRSFTVDAQRAPMYRLYNCYTGEHFYTASSSEVAQLGGAGWSGEGVGWIAPNLSGTPVYRLYNPFAKGGDHHYTTSAAERDGLVAVGWRYEGIGWYSDDLRRTALLREYNPYATSGAHNYTTSRSEHFQLCTVGWRDEGTAWYGM